MSKNNILKKKILIGLATASVLCGPMGTGYADVADKALPTGGTVYKGAVDIKTNEDTSTMNVFQTSNRAIIDWATFNVGKGATVNFVQTLDGKPNVAAMTLNRVNAAGGMSEIAGNINSIGSFLLVNPNGIMFYEGSAVNAAGVVLSTAEIDANEFYNNGRLYFSQKNDSNNNIIINGTINASTNGSYLTGANGMLAKLKDQVDNSSLNLDGIEFATGFSVANNVIKLVADGDIVIGNKGSLQAVTSTTLSGDKTVGAEEFSVEGESSTREGSITLRADQNADDINSEFKAAKVYLNNDDAAQIASHSVGIYYNPDLVEHDVDGVRKDIGGAKVADLGLTNTGADTYTQKDYTKYSEEAAVYKSKVAQSFTEFSRNDDKEAVTKTRGIRNQSYNMLVNNLYQMEAIQYSDKANMGGSYAQGTGFGAANTKNWNEGKGFKSIGSEDNAFHGSFTGHGGSNTYSITDLTINRSDENNVGLFGVAQKASFWSINLVDSNIIGKDNVGGIAGQATDHSKFSSVSVRKRVISSDGETKTANLDNVIGNDNVGGIVGYMTDGTIRFSNNGAQVSGHDNVGGLAGNLSGEAAGGSEEGSIYNIYKSSNNGYYSDNETVKQGYGVIKSTGDKASNTGGLVGLLASTNKDTTDADREAIIESKSNGQVQGINNVGGLVGELKSGIVKWSYNTNEDAALSKNSVVTSVSVGAGTSDYGRVNGTTNVGGIVGTMSHGKIEESYNAGNVKGSENVGGVVGNMSGGEITKAYNADNNTVLKSSNNDAEYYGFTVNTESGIDSYTYDNDKQTWLKNGTEKINADQLKAVPENTRMYYNRLAYRDATVTGISNVGGVVGSMSNGTMEQVYNAGQVKLDEGATATANIGAFVGNYTNGTISDSFYVTNENDGTAITKQNRAVGNIEGTFDGITPKTLNEAQNTEQTNWTGGKNTGNGWTIYNNSSTPLLNHFMKWININRQYEYDGTVHNLMTTDVDNYYGGAFFDNGDGKNVYSTNPRYGLVKDVMGGYNSSDWVIKSGSASADTSHSSVYTYDNSTMWSPQHGYYTHDDARMIITPKTVTATLVGEKTYGENAVEGAVDALTGEAPVAVAGSGKYTMQVEGFIGDDTADSVFKVDRSVAKYKDDKNQLGAGTYDKVEEFINPTFDYKDNNYNYNVEFKDTLKVNKADLYVDIVGTKVYGNDVSTGSYKYYAHEKNTKDEGSEISVNDVNNDGKLKSWETALATKEQAHVLTKDKVTALEADKDVNHNSITTGSHVINEFTDVIGEDKDDKFVPQAYKLSKVDIEGIDDTNKQLKTLEENYNLIFDMAKGSEGEVTVTPREIKMEVVGEKVYGQDALQGGVTITGAITPEALANASKDGHYVVKIDGYKEGDNPALEADFKDITYSQDGNKLDVGTYTNSSIFNNPTIKNNNFDGTTTVNHNYTGKITNKLTVKKADLYINVDGSKNYGDSINGNSAFYTYSAVSKNEANADGTATDKDKLNDGSLKSWNTKLSEGVLDKNNISYLTANDDVYHNTEKQESRNIDAKSNVITDNNGAVAYELEKAGFKVNTFNNLKNYNVIFDTSKGSQGKMTVKPVSLTVTSTGTKKYGDNAIEGGVLGTSPSEGSYNVTVSGYVAGDTTDSAFDVKLDNVKNGADNEKLAAGTYENSTNFTNPVFTAKKDYTYNYDITFKNKLTVEKVEPSTPPANQSTTTEPSTPPASEPTTTPKAEPKTVPASEPTTTPKTEPKTVPASEPTTTPKAEPKTVPASEPTTTPKAEPKTVPASEPTTTPKAEPKTSPTSEPTTTPKAEPKTSPTSEPTVAPAEEPSKVFNEVIIEIKETTEVIKAESKEVTEESKKIRYGGYIPKESRDGIRYITVEETGINVEEAKVENTTITIAPDSLVDDSSKVVISGETEAAAE